MKAVHLLLFALMGHLSLSYAQSEITSVRSSVDQLFDGMRVNDSLKIKAVLFDKCTLKTIAKNKENETVLQESDIRDFIKAVGTKRPGVQLDERLSSYDIKIDGDMAIAWTPYKFFVNDKFSHCGVNVFTLIHQPDGWKIMSITDTRRSDLCE